VAALLATAGLTPSAFAAAWFKTAANASDSWTATNYFSLHRSGAGRRSRDLLPPCGQWADDHRGQFRKQRDRHLSRLGDDLRRHRGLPRDNNPAVTLNESSAYIVTPNPVTNPTVFPLEM
jgi:hypothetical protein